VRTLGVGLVYWPQLEPLLDPSSTLSVIEVEPQSFWELTEHASGRSYRANTPLLDQLASHPVAKLLHGVNHPLGGSVADPVDAWPLFQDAVRRLDPVWISEHLSFNRVRGPNGVEHVGYLLPPRQSPAAVRVAAENISAFRTKLARPVAFETGVSYLGSRDDEMPDGEFFASVARASDSGVLLDLHNLWCNERNGRQTVADALAALPLERVWELHLAGGFEEFGFRLDAHSDAVPPEVIEIAARLIPELENLGAIVFEIIPEHLPRIGLDGVQRQLEQLGQLWCLRPSGLLRVARATPDRQDQLAASEADHAEVASWERALVSAVRGRLHPDAEFAELRSDPGCGAFKELIDEVRRAALTRALRFTMTSLLAALGPREIRSLLTAYFETQAPEPYPPAEADCFACFLQTRLPAHKQVPYLNEVLSFEHALIRATLHGASSEVVWSVDPTILLETLDSGKLPRDLPRAPSVTRICPE
jgi:uncharacterized protein (UPF0276 family)